MKALLLSALFVVVTTGPCGPVPPAPPPPPGCKRMVAVCVCDANALHCAWQWQCR